MEKNPVDPLTYEADPGTEVEIQSAINPECFYTGTVGGDSIVRGEDPVHVFNADNYVVIGEI